MKKIFVCILFLALAVPARSEDFQWSWEKGQDQAKKAGNQSGGSRQAEAAKPEPGGSAPDSADKLPAAGNAAPAAGTDENFLWSWEKEASGEKVKAGAPREVPAVPEVQKQDVKPPVAREPEKVQPASRPPSSPSSIDSRAYDELIRENLQLQRSIAEIKQDKDLARRENEKLGREVKDLERKIADSVSRISELSGQKKSSSDDPARLKELEARLKKAEQEKAQLNADLSALKKVASGTSGADSATGVSRPSSPIKQGSDLYRQIESENTILKQKLVELEADRQKTIKSRTEKEKEEMLAAEEARRAVEAQKEMKAKLESAKSSENKQKKLVADLAERIPGMQKEMTVLQRKVAEKDAVLRENERNLEILASEIEQRENRIRKAEKMVSLMEQAQKDVSQVSDTEKRDMHYNMASVYAQVGRFRDAEREYLHALRLDPLDADVHYNLGILYDENLNDKQRAAMHYRRYLKLRPNGSDVDSVKNWLMNIDMKP